MMPNQWFDVDKEGLAKILERRGGKAFIIYELLQNSWDEPGVTQVDATLIPVPNRPLARLVVMDDAPQGFSKLSDAFTLFAESKKKGDAQLRGRFNLGEKLVLACCEEATIDTTTGQVMFDANGQRTTNKRKIESGSIFSAILRITRQEVESVNEAIYRLIPPKNILTLYNGKEIRHREPLTEFEAILPTEVADDEGNLRRTKRKTMIRVYEPDFDEEASVYEMGIPVVTTGDKYHVDIQQKVPMSLDRDNVPPAVLQDIRLYVLNHTFDRIQGEDEANQTWVKDALADERCEAAATRKVIQEQYGDKAVIFDPSDPEANKLAVSQGYTVIPGGAFNSNQWKNIKQSGASAPAGKVTPSAKPYGEDGNPLNLIPERSWTDGMRKVAAYAKMLAEYLMDVKISVEIARERSWPYLATYGPSGPLTFNVNRCGRQFFEQFPANMEAVDNLLLHEFGHQYCSDHLSKDYYRALTRLGAKIKKLALDHPELFGEFSS